MGDVTGDGHPDLAGKTAKGQVTIYPGNGKTGFLAPRTAPTAMRTFNLIGSGTWQPLNVLARFTSPDGSFVPFVGTTGTNLAGYDWVVGPGDVDGDGRATWSPGTVSGPCGCSRGRRSHWVHVVSSASGSAPTGSVAEQGHAARPWSARRRDVRPRCCREGGAGGPATPGGPAARGMR